ncbi:MAG: iron-containing redox enzyme family protein [Moorea sp. SIO3C2]|nr:iron-containing redox enzyme family protein [Moorena sp. SIO3C2]
MNYSGLAEKTVQTLDCIAQEGAKEIAAAFDLATRTNYIHLVSTFYHYSAPGETQLLRAAEAAPTNAMKMLYIHLARDEADHDILAIRDLKALGYKLEPESKLTAGYHAYWSNFSDEKVIEYLGMNVVIEYLISYLNSCAKTMRERLKLKAEECTWLQLHCEEDEQHGEAAVKCVKEHINERFADLMIKGGMGDKRRFVSMFIDALQNNASLNPL